MQTVVEELETSNEELQSTNEELQSSNEELETANEELQSTNEDLNNIKESIDYPILVVNKELKITRFNKASTDLFALADDTHGEALTNVVTCIDIPHLRQDVETVIKKQASHAHQLDFEEVSYLERITPYRNESGRVDGAILTYVNNTTERKAQVKLAESESRFQLAVAGSSSGIWDLHIKSGRMYCSAIMFKIMGIRVDNEKYTLKQFERRIHPDDVQSFKAYYEKHLSDHEDFNMEFRLKKDRVAMSGLKCVGKRYGMRTGMRAAWQDHLMIFPNGWTHKSS
ncbi:MAG: PAS domain-containing protein [Alphaproteobacteria bacterium]|nr:PAS domain-containing protein [Alphaproteobacteria bacterium]